MKTDKNSFSLKKNKLAKESGYKELEKLEKDIFIAIGNEEHPAKFVNGKWYKWENRFDDLGKDLAELKRRVGRLKEKE